MNNNSDAIVIDSLSMPNDDIEETPKPLKTAINDVAGKKPHYRFTLDNDNNVIGYLEYSNQGRIKSFESTSEFEKREAKLFYEKHGYRLNPHDSELLPTIQRLQLYTRLLYEHEVVDKVPRGKLFSAKMTLVGGATPTRIDFLDGQKHENLPSGVSINTPGVKLFKIKIINGSGGAIKLDFNTKPGEKIVTKEMAASATEEFVWDSAIWDSILICALTADSVVDITGLY